MKKSVKWAILCCALVCIFSMVGVFTINHTAFADGEYTRDLRVSGITVTVGNKTINDVYSDPVDYWEDSASGSLNGYEIIYESVGAKDAVIYTALYPDTTTGRTGDITEYVCELQGADYVVTQINTNGDGTTYIPVGGFVLSLCNEKNADFAKVGDIVKLSGGKLTIPTKAVESDSGKRVVVDNTNTTRSMPMVVYYDYQFGSKTGTNVFGTEMTCEYDFEENSFIVTDFRGFGQGDDSGSEIPDNSFVLSAYGEGFRQLLIEGMLFSERDKVKMVGFDFVRFGGTVYGEYDFVNPTPEENPAGMETETSPFPAYRGENQTIIYKSGWSYQGSAGTGTNVYGYEAAVDATGVVVELNVNVSKIPEGGYVISGHGTGRDFIRSNIVLGATVVLDEDNKTFAVSTTLNSYYENLALSVNQAVKNAQTMIGQLYDVNQELLETYITNVSSELENLKVVKEEIEAKLEGDISEEERLSLLMSYNNSQLAIEKLRQQIVVASAESKVVSARSVWHRPIEMTYSAIEENIKMYSDIGINLIFVETLYNGYSTFKSDIAEFPYNNKLADKYTTSEGVEYTDYLTAFTQCAKEYGIEVHAWVENFYISTLNTAKVLQDHPDWIMYNDDNTYYQRNEGGLYIFIDPANKEVQDTLINYYNDLFEKVPDVKGLNLDYIRYPVSDSAEDTGYTIPAMKGFYESLGKTFSSAQLNDREKMANKFKQLFDPNYLLGGQAEADENYQLWVEYRTNIITEYVRRIKDEVKLPNNIVLSTAVFASLSESTNSKKQDWQTWFSNGWIDIATPMAYYTDASDVLVRVHEMILMAGNNCYYYSGIAPSFQGLPAWQNKEQIEASYDAGATGYVIFCSTQILGHKDVQLALQSGVNSKKAVLPHSSVETILSATFEDIADKATRLYIPNGGMTEDQLTALNSAFDTIKAIQADDAVGIFKVKSAVEELADSSIKDIAKGYSRQRIVEQLDELADLLDSKISLQLIQDGEWNPEEEERRPIVNEDGIFPNVDPEPEPEPEPEPKPEPNPEPEPQSNVGLIIGIVIACVAVVAGGVTAVVLLRRRNKSK